MYKVLQISKKLQDKTNKFNLNKKLVKATELLSNNPNHPGLHTELLEPKENGFHSFRINLKYRGIFIIHPDKKTIQIIGITVHYS